MAEKVGDVYLEAHVRGDGVDADAERAGNRAADSFQDEFDKETKALGAETMERFEKRMKKGMEKAGRTSGQDYFKALRRSVKRADLDGIAREVVKALDFEEGFDKYVKGAGGVENANRRLTESLEKLRDRGLLSQKAFDRYSSSLRTNVSRTRAATEAAERLSTQQEHLVNETRIKNRLDEIAAERTKELTDRSEKLSEEIEDVDEKTRSAADGSNRLGDAMRRLAGRMKNNTSLWGSLSHNTRQWTLIIGSAIAGMQLMATFSSALGAGLLALVGVAGSLVVGIGGLAAVFHALSQDAEDLPESMRKVRREFDDFKNAVAEARDTIAESAFDEMDGVFTSLADTVRGLNPQFERLGEVIGTLFNDFADSVAVGSEGFDLIKEFIDNAIDNFDSLARTAGTFIEGLMRGINRAQPLIDQFLGWIDDLATSFNEFTKSDSFDIWLERAERIFGKFGELLEGIGELLDHLVDESSVDNLVDFLDNLKKFLPHLENLFEIFGDLDPFGLLAQALADIGDALEPLAQPMADLAEAIGEVIALAIDEWAKNLAPLAKKLAPVVDEIARFLKEADEEDIRAIAKAIGVLVAALLGFKLLSGVVGIISAIGTVIVNVIGAFKKFKNFKFGPAVSGFLKVVGKVAGAAGVLIGALTFVYNWFKEGPGYAFGELLGSFFDSVSLALGPIGILFRTFFDDLIPDEWLESDNPLKVALAAIERILTDTGNVVKAILENWPLIWDTIKQGAEDFWNKVQKLVEDIGGAIEDFVDDVIEDLKRLLEFFGIYTDRNGKQWDNHTRRFAKRTKEKFSESKKSIEDNMNKAASGIKKSADRSKDKWDTFTAGFQRRTDQKFSGSRKAIADELGKSGSRIEGFSRVNSERWKNFTSRFERRTKNKMKGARKSVASNLRQVDDKIGHTGGRFNALANRVRLTSDRVSKRMSTARKNVGNNLLRIEGSIGSAGGRFKALSRRVKITKDDVAGSMGRMRDNTALRLSHIKDRIGEAGGRFKDLGRRVGITKDRVAKEMGRLRDNVGLRLGHVKDRIGEANSKFKSMPGAAASGAEGVSGALGGIVDTIKWVIDWIQSAINRLGALISEAGRAGRSLGELPSKNIPSPTPTASGGLFLGPSHRLIGEAGPEAVVPLNRNLSQVDPSVRWLSAFAQGKASGSAPGGSTIEPGAIVIQGAVDPRRTAVEVVDRIVERVVA